MRDNVIRLDLGCRTSHHGAVPRKTVTAAYYPERLGFDLAELLDELKNTPDSVYFSRSTAILAGMLLAERAQEELQKVQGTKRRREAS